MNTQILYIIKRDKPMGHYEVHFISHVEFRRLNGEQVACAVKVEVVEHSQKP